jgi:hypothetical protein
MNYPLLHWNSLNTEYSFTSEEMICYVNQLVNGNLHFDGLWCLWVVTIYYFSKLDHGTSAGGSTVGFRLFFIDPVHNARSHSVDAVDTSFPERLYMEVGRLHCAVKFVPQPNPHSSEIKH